MATIQVVINAINNASRVVDQVKHSYEALAAAEDMAQKTSETLTKTLQSQGASAKLAAAALEALTRQETAAVAISKPLAAAMDRLAKTGGLAAMALQEGADAAKEDARDLGLAAVGAGILSDKLGTLTTKASLAALALRAEAVAAQVAFGPPGNPLVSALGVAGGRQGYGSQGWLAPVASPSTAALLAAGRASGGGPSSFGIFPAGFNGGSGGGGGGGVAGLAAGAAWGGGWIRGAARALSQPVTLFGGIFGSTFLLGQIARWHLLADAIFEVGAVWIPAGIAAEAFAVAASDSFRKVYKEITNMHTVMDGTGQTMSVFTGGLEKMHQAAQPQVYQLLGDAILVIQKRTGVFASLAQQAGTVFDQLGARVAAALMSANFQTWIHDAIPDLKLLGTAFGNLFGTLGNLLQAVPGYAKYLLMLGTAILGVTEYLSYLLEPVIKVGLELHGFIIYVGLAVTALTYLWLSLQSGALGTFALFLGRVIGAIGVFVISLFEADGAIEVFNIINEAMTAWGWIILGVSLLVGLIFWIKGATNAQKNLTDSLQKTVDQAPTIAAGITAVGVAQQTMSASLVSSQKQLGDTAKYTTEWVGRGATAVRVLSSQYQLAQGNVAGAKSGLAQFNAEAAMNEARIQSLDHTYGDANAAMGLLAAAGITQKQWQDKSAQGWLLIQTQVAATVAGYKLMGQQSGTLGNDLDVLNKFATDQYKAMQSLNQAWSQQQAAVTGTSSSFDAFQLDLITMAANFQQTTGHALTATNSLHGLRSVVPAVGAVIGGLTQQDLQLNEGFQTAITNADTMFGTWRQAGVATGPFTAGVKATIVQLLQFAKGNTAGTAALVSLAQEAGYKGPISFKALQNWLGNVSNATYQVQQTTLLATTQEALLTTAMGNQATFISQTLLNDLSKAELAYSGLPGVVATYGKAVAEHGLGSPAAQTAAQQAIDKAAAFGRKMNWTQAQVVALGQQMTQLPQNLVLRMTMKAAGTWLVTGNSGNVVGTSPQKGGASATVINGQLVLRAADGLRVRGGIPGVDSVPILAQQGEVVVPTRLVNAGALSHLKGQIPGFAQGGVVGSYASSSPAGLGSWSAGMYGETLIAVASATAQAADAAMKAAQAVANSISAGSGGPGGGAPSANAALARRLMPSWGSGTEWIAWNNLAMAESGWNNFARNASSGAYGIAQALPPTKYPFAGQAGGGSNPTAQIDWMIAYIEGRYGNPLNAWAHEAAFHWYDRGGWLAPGLTMAVNATGRPERVVPSGGGGDPIAEQLAQTNELLGQLCELQAAAPARTAVGVAKATSGRTGAYRAAYSPRG